MINNHTRVRKGNFTESDVTPRHFVTPNAGCGQASPLRSHDQLEPVTRRYRPDPAALEELVDVLYRLLVNVPVTEPAAAPALPEPACFSNARE